MKMMLWDIRVRMKKIRVRDEMWKIERDMRMGDDWEIMSNPIWECEQVRKLYSICKDI